MGKARQEAKRRKRRLAHALRAAHARRGREVTESRRAAELRAIRRVGAEEALARLRPRPLSESAHRRFQKTYDWTVWSFMIALVPFVVTIPLRELFDVDFVRYAALSGVVFGFVGALVALVSSLPLYILNFREIVGSWMMYSAVSIGLVGYILWGRLWATLLVMVGVAVAGLIVAIWGNRAVARLIEESKAG